MTNIDKALYSLGIKGWSIVGNFPQSENEFVERFRILNQSNKWITEPAQWGVTWQQIQTEIARLQAEYDAKQYQRDRAAEYPSFADQFDTLYHNGYDAWKAQIDAIKLKYPKP